MAAGLGYKEFTTGDVLTAADANGYLASQVVMVFADSAARTTAISSPQEGMIAYLKDTNAVEKYDGAAWVAVGGASTSGLTLITKSPFTTVSSHSVNNCFTSTYANYKILIKWSAVSNDNVDLSMKLRASGSDTSTNYNSQRIFNGTTSTLATDTDNNGTDEWMAGIADKDFATAGFSEIEIASPQAATNTSMLMRNWGYTTFGILHLIGGRQNSSTQFDGFTILAAAGTMSGTVYVYGYQES